MSLQFYQILHVSSVLLLAGVTFAIFGGAPLSRKKLLMALSGILSVLALFAGFGLASHKGGVVQQPNPAHWPLWIWIKVFVWLWLSALGGIAFKKRDQTKAPLIITIIVVIVAIATVYTKPFSG